MSKVLDIITCKCPNCQKEKMFSSNGNIFLFSKPKMDKRCKNCNYKFERETGFFYGAMFVAYALAAAEMIASLILFWYLIGLSPITVFLIIVLNAFLFSTFNFRLSRTIWIYIFYRD